MLYILQAVGDSSNIVVVKAKDEEEVKDRMKFDGTMVVVGQLTDTEIAVLSLARFGALSA